MVPSLPSDLTATARNPVKKRVVKGKLTGTSVMFTGFRSAELEAKIEALGGVIATTVPRSTILVTKTKDSTSAKALIAKKLGVRCMTQAEFEAFLKK